MHADLTVLGYEGSYNRVAAFARDWKAARQLEQRTTGRDVFVPLVFATGEAFQFDWSEDWAMIGDCQDFRVGAAIEDLEVPDGPTQSCPHP